MSQIGTLTTGAGITTTINLQYVPEFIVVGSSFVAAGIVLQGVSWNVSGKELVNVAGSNPVNALAKFKGNGDLTNQIVAQILQTGFGYLPNKQFQLRLENAGVTTPAVYAFSRRVGNGRVFTASQQVVLDGANQRYQNFLSLMFADTNVSRVDITFRNARTQQVFQDSLTPTELATLFAADNISEGGDLSSMTIIDNTALLTKQGIYVESCNLFASGGNVTVTVEGLAQL